MDAARDELLSGRVRRDRLGRFNVRGVIADEQTGGHGQRGNSWYAARAESLCATYYFQHGLVSPETAGEVALLAGVAVADVIHNATQRDIDYSSPPPVPAVRVGLKWPNDLLLGAKKAGGILVELVRIPDADWVALIGVGINVSVLKFPPELADHATSIAIEWPDRDLTKLQLAYSIPRGLNRIARIRRTQGLSAVLRRWRRYDETRGRRYQFEQDGVKLEGIAEGIDDAGGLMLRIHGGGLTTSYSASSLTELRR